jgi:enterochelin esterase-like enzyme
MTVAVLQRGHHFGAPASGALPPYFRTVNPRTLPRVIAFALLGAVAALAQTSANRPAAPAEKGRGSGKAPKGPRPDFWSGGFNYSGSFSDRGIEGFQHHVFVSKKINYKGAAETEIGYTVYLPPDYATSGERYPVLYFLHGLGGNENTVAPVVTTAHELITRKELPPFIIVSAATGRGFYGNQFEGKLQIHDFYFEEFIPHIEKTYRAKADRRHRHLAGFSMGGYGALMYALKHLDLFGTATDIGGALGAARNNYWQEMYDANEANYAPFDLHKLTEENLGRLKKGDLRLAIWIGAEDMVKGANIQYGALLKEKGVPHSYNDWNNRPKLEDVGHQLPRYFELYGKEILQFHTQVFEK